MYDRNRSFSQNRPKLRWSLPNPQIIKKWQFLLISRNFSEIFTRLKWYFIHFNLISIRIHTSNQCGIWFLNGYFLVCLIFEKKLPIFLRIFNYFVARDSAETSAEASVDLAEASVLAESHFRAFRSFVTWHWISRLFHTVLSDYKKIREINSAANSLVKMFLPRNLC